MTKAIIWFRQDLRLSDNPAFSEACRQHDEVLPLYILDEATVTLGGAQRWWLHHSLVCLDADLKKVGLRLCLHQGSALAVLKSLVKENQVVTIYWNRCYEPLAIERDTKIKHFFQKSGVRVVSSNGRLLHEPWEITNKTGHFFKVFTPFWRACLKQMSIPEQQTISRFPTLIEANSESLNSWALLPSKPDWSETFGQHWRPGEEGARSKLSDFIENHLKGYMTSRNEPATDSTSKLSPHLHFGEISPWQIWRSIEAVTLDRDCNLKSVERFLAELGWREFSYHLLYHVPLLPSANFKSDFDAFPWKNNDVFLKCWQEGKTGYPIIDAGMRELWRTGYMHNRVRMIVASFLTKDLLIDWRYGADWFLDTLVDADMASNSASWQWVAGCGADAAPYFRIFNPVLQGEKFDPEGLYVKRWVPELASVPVQWIHQPWMAPQDALEVVLGRDYPKPIVDHLEARKQALFYYKMMKQSDEKE
jgi:deoxyribodipyrimidine photo-lyase